MPIKNYIINLERAHERRQNVVKEFIQYGVEYELVSGIDWRDLSEQDIVNWVDPKVKRREQIYGQTIDKGSLACWLSHRKVWEIGIRNNLDLIAVFEDDATLTNRTREILLKIETLQSLENFNFDIIFLYNGKPRKPYIPIHRLNDEFTLGLVKYDSIGAVGYVITQHAIRRLMRDFPRMNFCVDTVMHAYWMTSLKTYVLMPQVVFHGTENSGHHSYNEESHFFFSDDNSKSLSNIRKLLTKLQKSSNTLLNKDIPKRIGFKRRIKDEVISMEES